MNQYRPQNPDQKNFDYNEEHQQRTGYVSLQERIKFQSMDDGSSSNHLRETSMDRLREELKIVFVNGRLRLSDLQMFLINVIIFGLCLYIFAKTIVYCCPGILLRGAMALVILLFIRRFIERFHEE